MHNAKKDMLGRTDFEQVRDFLLRGPSALDAAENEDYCERLSAGEEAIFKRLKNLCPDDESLDAAHNDLGDALRTYEDVCIELGMKFGAKLIYQLLLTK